jgi:hypothetical protein
MKDTLRDKIAEIVDYCSESYYPEHEYGNTWADRNKEYLAEAVDQILSLIEEEEIDENTSDGFHTFKELYDHRIALFIALMKSHPELSWRANNHDDGTGIDNWFIAGMHLPTGDISYHLPATDWTKLDNVGIKTSNRSPKWDGHTPADVVSRLNSWSANMGLSRKLANKATLNSKEQK